MIQFLLVSSSTHERGLIGYGELLDLVYDFASIAKAHGASVCHLDNGSLIATKESLSVSLTIGETEEIFPSRRLLTCLEEMMDLCFGQR